MHSQKGIRVEPTGEVQEKKIPAHLVVHMNGRVEGRQLRWKEGKCTDQKRVTGGGH